MEKKTFAFLIIFAKFAANYEPKHFGYYDRNIKPTQQWHYQAL